MCGICGIVGPGDHRVEMGRMLELIRHRGPDGGGQWQDGDACLGMRRLSIIDLAGGDQPMLASDGQVGIVFNGEIYNYVELRDALRGRGHRFETESDTEVLLRAYLEYDTACVDHLRGMFAFAIWDRPRARLFIARDRLGKKPLYYGLRGRDLVFTSELKALTCLPDLRLEIDPIALDHYFTYRYVPGPRTIFRGFSKLQPGCALLWTGGTLRTWRYWAPPFDDRPPASLTVDEAVGRLRETLSEAVRLRMRSDVPVGVLLSGGVDSSVIAALMARLTPRPIQTFTVGFAAGRGVDESGAARRVAKFLGSRHHELTVEGNAIELLPTVVWHLDEPLADAAALPTYQIATLARQHVKVVLTGEGADELFGGYRYIRTLYYTTIADRLPRPLRTILAGLAGPMALAPPRDFTARLARVLRSLPRDLPSRYRRMVSVFDEAARQRLLAPLGPALAAEQEGIRMVDFPSRERVPGDLDWLLAALTETWLPDDLLMKVDKMSMAVGLEARTPFLDHRLVEEMARVPGGYKIRGWTGKYLLRRLAGELLPASVATRPKHGFDVPLDAWFRGELRPLLLDTLESRAIKDTGILDVAEVRRIAADHLAARADYGQQLWTIVCFQVWYERFIRLASAPVLCTRETR